jgi:hypothetical protein
MKPIWLREPKYRNPKPSSCDPEAQRRIGSRSVSDHTSTKQWLRTTLILGTLCECWPDVLVGAQPMVPNSRH